MSGEDLPVEVIAILLAAGRGSRMGGGENKIFQKIGSKTMLELAADRLWGHPDLSLLLVLVADEDKERAEALLSSSMPRGSYRLVSGGESRQESSLLGLRAAAAAASREPGRRTLALIHDAARCLLPPGLVNDLIQVIRKERCGAAPAIPVTDTVRLLDKPGGALEETLPRDRLVAAQTPQGADLDILLEAAELAFKESAEVTDDLELLIRIGFPVRLIPGHPDNIKITRPVDRKLALSLMEQGDLTEADSVQTAL